MLKYLTSKLNTKNLDYLHRTITNFSKHSLIISDFNKLNPNLKIVRFSTNNVAPRVFLKKYLENSFAYSSLEPLSKDVKIKTLPEEKNKQDRIISEREFNEFLDKNWRKCNVQEIINGFNYVLPFCIENNINISDERFDKLIDGTLDNIEKMSTEDIINTLTFLNKAPLTEGVSAHNYHDLWSALDDVCCWKLRNWDLETSFRVAELWYKLGLGRICDFIYELLEKHSKKPSKLSKSELVYIFFYFNVCRKRNMDFLYEDAIEKKIHLMTPNEIGIVAMGFFKTQTKVKSVNTLNAMLDCVINNTKSIHEITLASIVKIIRLSHHPLTATKTSELLEQITPEINRLSNVSCLHVALLGTGLQILNEKTLTVICEKISKDLEDTNKIRLKDIERLLLTLTMFDFKPSISTGDIYELLLKQLSNPRRAPEREEHPKCVPCALLFLAIRDIYPEGLINDVFNPEFIKKVYGKRWGDIPRELYTLDMNLEIERPDYKGNRIPLDVRRKCAKIYIERLPRKDKKSMNAADRLIYDVVETCTNIVGDSNKVFLGHILPQYVKADIVLCYDKTIQDFTTPSFNKYQIGDIVRPLNLENYKWIVVLTVSVNTMIRYLFKPVGFMNLKRRQLKLLGYETVLVPYHEYLPLEEDDKIEYVRSKIKELIK